VVIVVLKKLGAALVVGAVVAGCGSSSSPSHSSGSSGGGSKSSACVVLQNGSQLCGSAAASYCQGFETNPPNQQTIKACEAVDPSYLPPASDPGGIACDEYPTNQQQNECIKAETGQ
jgi:hypothetical protein